MDQSKEFKIYFLFKLKFYPPSFFMSSSSSSENEYSDEDSINSGGNSSISQGLDTSKKRSRRPNHNEIERMRRNSQRQRFEELRLLLPNLKGDRATSVAIINSAISYIKDVQNRLSYMENILAAVNMTNSPSTLTSNSFKNVDIDMYGNQQHNTLSPLHYDPFSAPNCKKTKKVSYIKVPTKPELFDTENILSYIQKSNAPIISNHSSPNFIPSPDNLFGSSANLLLNDDSMTRPKLRKSSFVPAIRRRNSSTSSSDSSSQDVGLFKRRESSLLLPTNDPNTFLFGRRDSMQTLFSGSLPMFFDDGDACLSSGGKCQKCNGGVDNLVMVDCGTCLGWFHIRCVGIDAQQIPIFWDCSECRKPSLIGSKSIPIKDLPSAPPIVSNGLEFSKISPLLKAATSPLNVIQSSLPTDTSTTTSPSNKGSVTPRLLSPALPYNRNTLPK